METKPLSEAMREFESKAKINEAKMIDKKKAQAGDIIKVTGMVVAGNTRDDFHFTVIELNGKTGFYLYYSNANGKPTDKGNMNVAHSNSIFIDSFEKVGEMNFHVGKIKGMEYTITGIDHVDNQMSALGNAYKIFAEYAPRAVQAEFEKNQDYNNHAKNRELISDFLAHMSKGGKPEEFGSYLSQEEVLQIVNKIAELSSFVADMVRKHKGENMEDRLEDIKTKLIMARKEAEAVQSEIK